MPWTRFLAAVLLANILSMSLGNFLKMQVNYLVWLYPLIAILSWFLLGNLRFRRSRFPVGAAAIVWVALFVILLAVPRITYVFEWIGGYSAIPLADDYGRLGEMVALTQSTNFPLLHPSNQAYTFSYYYAALIPWAVLKLAIPLLTLKDILFVGNAGYHLLILMSLLEVGSRWLPSKRSLSGFLFLCTFFGGLEWFFYSWFHAYLGLTEDWHEQFFNGNAQISSFHTGFYWVVHHMVSFYSLVLASVVLKDTRVRARYVKGIIVGLLLIHSFYSSIFVFIAAFPFFWIERKIFWRLFVNVRVLPFLVFVFLPPLFLYTDRSYDVAWIPATFRLVITDNFWLDKLISAPLYLVLVPVVEFAGIPLYILCFRKLLSRRERAYLTGAWLFLGIIYLLAVSDANNFAMRGMFLPSFIFFVILCRYERPR